MNVGDREKRRDASSAFATTAGLAYPDAPSTSPLAAQVLRNQVYASLLGKPAEPVTVGRFRLRACIGAGAMGELFAAYDDQLDREVAIKLVHPRPTAHAPDQADQRLLREAKILARISHPNVVHVYEVGQLDGRVFVAMELVRGSTLTRWLQSRPDERPIGRPAHEERPTHDAPRPAARPSARDILRRFLAAGRGLAAAHDAGLAHRDFKPDNVLIGEDDRVRVVDFGLARAVAPWADIHDPDAPPADHHHQRPDSAPLSLTLTATGALLGTPRYMAPEQWRGQRGDSRSDQFSFCVTLYEALYDARPFPGDTAVELADAVRRGDVPAPPRVAGVSTAVRNALLRGLSRDPEARFPTMNGLLAVIERSLQRERTTRTIALLLLVAALGAAIALLGRDDDTAAVQREQNAAGRLTVVEDRIAELTAQDDTAEADEIFAAFAALPEHHETTALARGWLHHADRLRARGDDHSDGEVTAYASAYTNASQRAEQGQALLGLARVFRRTHQWDRLGATLRTLVRTHPELAESPEMRALRVEDAVARRDFEHAVRELDRVISSDGQNSTERDIALAPEAITAIRAVARVQVTEHLQERGRDLRRLVQHAPGLDLDRDGRGELIAVLGDDQHISVLGTGHPSLPLLSRIDSPDRPRAIFGLPAVPGQRPAVVVDTPRSRTLHGIAARGAAGQPPSLTVMHRWRHGEIPVGAITFGDVDGDGAAELYISQGTESPRFAGLIPGSDDTWQATEPYPPIDDSNSWIREMVVGDIDGDGRNELIVAVGEWAAYDLRVFHATRAEGQLELVARRKLGTIMGLALLPAPSGQGQRIAVEISPRYPNKRVFEPESPHGEPPGVYLLEWRDGLLDIVHYLPLPPAFQSQPRMSTGDINGDGLADLIVATGGIGRNTTLLIQTPAGQFAELTLRQLSVSAALDLDDDQQDELIAVHTPLRPPELHDTAPITIIGAEGPGVLPVLHNPNPPPATPPSGIDQALRLAWQRAEDLAAIGLPIRAADALQRVAAVADRQTSSRSLARAAEFLASAERRDRAAALYEEAASDSDQPLELWTRAVDLYDRLFRFADALRLTEQILASSALSHAQRTAWIPRAENLRNHIAPKKLSFTFDRPLDDSWRVLHPLALRRDGRTLRAELFNSHERVVARRPVWWDGGALSLEAEIDILEIEWGGGIYIALVAPGEGDAWFHPIVVGLGAGGGGGVYSRAAICRYNARNNTSPQMDLSDHPRVSLTADQQRHQWRLDVIPQRGQTACSAHVEGTKSTMLDEISDELAPNGFPPGWYELVIMATKNGLDGSPIRSTVRIHRIELTGVSDHPSDRAGQPAPPPGDPIRDALYRDLSNGDLDAVLSRLDSRPAGRTGEPIGQLAGAISRHEAEILQYLAFDGLARRTEAESALRAALSVSRPGQRASRCAGPEGEEWLVRQLLHLRPALLGPTLRRICHPAAYYHELWRTWKHRLHQHPEEESLHRTISTQLGDIESYQPRPRDALPFVRLLRARGRAWAALGSPAAARADFQRAIDVGHSLAESAEVRRDPTMYRSLKQALAFCHRKLAEVLLTSGDRDGAIAEVRNALQHTATPAIMADILATRPRLRDLHDHPDWDGLLTPLLTGAAGPAGHAPESTGQPVEPGPGQPAE